LANGKPVKLFQERLCRSSFRHTENDACCCVLDVLQFLDAAGRDSMQHSITVVQTRQY